MDNLFKSINIHVSLSNSTLESYSYKLEKGENFVNDLIITIITPSAEMMEFVFYDVSYFGYNHGHTITDFGECRNSFLEEIVKNTYEKIPENYKEKLFQFLDINKEPFLEIVCEKFESHFVNPITY